MHAQVAGQLGMERGPPHDAAAHEHRLARVLGEHLDVVADPLDDRRADEHAGECRPREPVDVEVGFERVALTAVRVAPHGDVEHSERFLVGAAVDVGGTGAPSSR